VSIPELGERVAEWAEPLGYTSGSASPWTCVVASVGGEDRLYVRQSGDEIVVSSATRSSDERFLMSSQRVDDCEKFLVAHLGASVRGRLLPDSPALTLPAEPSEIVPPFALEPAADDPGRAIVLESGAYRARFPSFVGPRAAVLFSHYANESVELLKSSFLDTTGELLFPLNPDRLSSGRRALT
jgi:hypothetical protein